jgi:dipeptide/tripeptide permease
VVRPHLGPPPPPEPAGPPRFAQGVGLAFAVVGLLGSLSGSTPLTQVAVGAALAAAFLNAAFGVCLGCEVYLLARRTFPSSAQPNDERSPATHKEVSA